MGSLSRLLGADFIIKRPSASWHFLCSKTSSKVQAMHIVDPELSTCIEMQLKREQEAYRYVVWLVAALPKIGIER